MGCHNEHLRTASHRHKRKKHFSFLILNQNHRLLRAIERSLDYIYCAVLPGKFPFCKSLELASSTHHLKEKNSVSIPFSISPSGF